MKAFFTKLLKNKVKKKLQNSDSATLNFVSSPLFKYLFPGVGTVFLAFICFIVLITVVFSPVMLSEEYIKKVDTGISDFFEKTGNFFALKGWCTDSECGNSFDEKYYAELDRVSQSYKNRGITLNVDLITGTIYYNSSINSDSDMDLSYISDVSTLASNMVNGSSIDYGKYRSYLVNTYIPYRFSNLYSDDLGKERIADDIMAYADYNRSIAANTQQSYLSIVCPEICTTDGDCWGLEEYVSRVVSAESGLFDGLINNYQEQWKAQAVAARTVGLEKTNYCKKPIENSTNAQVADRSDNIKQEIIDAVKETEGKILTYEGEITSAPYDSFYKGNNYHCDNEFCYATYKKAGGKSNPVSHEIKVYKKWEGRLAGGHGNGMSQYGAAYLADTGMKYEDILKYFYDDDVEISFIGGTMGLGEITEGILFPLGVNSKTGSCVSAGNYYMGGKYHGAVDIAGAMMGYSKPYEEIPVVSSTPGVITSLTNNAWCTDTKLSNGDSRLPRVPGCQGNNMTIKVTDSSHKYYNYSFIYYHFDSIDSNLKVGDYVQAGQMLGYMGSTGNSTGFHLHYKIKNPSGGDLNNTPVQDYVTELIKSYCKNNKEE